uniref:Uncharacterized protein n=1 Tax=Plectus sambesii TaxID=2011161 RepID=A0A914X158_9BILA
MTLPLPALLQFNGKEEDFPAWLAQFSSALHYTKVKKSEDKHSLLLMCISQWVVCTLISMTLHYHTTPIKLAEYHRLFSLRQQPGAGFSKRREGAGCTRGTRTRYPGCSNFFRAGYGFPGRAREGQALPLLGAVVASAGK